MSLAELIQKHRPWEDWLGIGLGLLVAFSPWFFAAENGSAAVFLNTVVVGVLIVAVAVMEYFDRSRWEESFQLVCGLWLMLAPVVLGYAGPLAYLHVGLGLLIAILAGLEFLQTGRTERK